MSDYRKQEKYFENLDALRFIAALMVLNAHLVTLATLPAGKIGKYLGILLTLDGSGGNLGVSFFFVLSGFLITYLIFKEFHITQSFSIRNFYIRRLLRIWPLYYTVLFIGFFVYPAIVYAGTEFQGTGSQIRYFLFLANFDQIYFQGPHVEMLGVLWSVCVEEQFYLFWPLLFVAVRQHRNLPLIFLSIIVGSNIFRISGGHEFHTITALSDLSTGALLAYGSFFYQDRVKDFFRKLGRMNTAIVYVFGILMLVLNFQLNKHFAFYGLVDRMAHALFFAFVIADQSFSDYTPLKMSALPFLSRWGRISYGIYMLNALAILIIVRLTEGLPTNFYLQGLAAFALTIGLSELSYAYLERYFLGLKKRYLTTQTLHKLFVP